MEFKVLLEKKAKKDLDKINKSMQARIFIKIKKLSKYPHLGKQLLGKLKGLYSLRVWPYRVIYEIDKLNQVIIILAIGHRQKIYQELKN